MKLLKGFKFIAMLAVVLAIASGCASKPAEDEVDTSVEQARAAIIDARAAHATVNPAHADFTAIGNMIADAEPALAAGDTGLAIRLANEARARAEAAARESVSAKIDDSKPGSYTVERGDSLWAISGKSDIYGNPYQWPLIYKANRDKIKDADLIHPGQQFKIERAATQAQIDAAVNHARTRGAWSLGVAEESDMRYLSR